MDRVSQESLDRELRNIWKAREQHRVELERVKQTQEYDSLERALFRARRKFSILLRKKKSLRRVLSLGQIMLTTDLEGYMSKKRKLQARDATRPDSEEKASQMEGTIDAIIDAYEEVLRINKELYDFYYGLSP